MWNAALSLVPVPEIYFLLYSALLNTLSLFLAFTPKSSSFTQVQSCLFFPLTKHYLMYQFGKYFFFLNGDPRLSMFIAAIFITAGRCKGPSLDV